VGKSKRFLIAYNSLMLVLDSSPLSAMTMGFDSLYLASTAFTIGKKSSPQKYSLQRYHNQLGTHFLPQVIQVIFEGAEIYHL